MSGIFDAIFGDPATQTPDGQGLTTSDRAQAGFAGLGQLGATLLAAGQPMWGNERARILAGLGNVPGTIQESLNGAVGRRGAAQKIQLSQRQLEAQKAMMEMANSNMEGMSPQLAAVMKSAFLSGNPQTAMAALKEAREAVQPVPMGGGNFWDRKSNTVINPITNMRIPLDASGAPNMNGATYASGAPVEPDDMTPHADTGFREGWLTKQNLPAGVGAEVKAIAEGRQSLPTARDPQRTLVLNTLHQYAPDYSEGDFTAKKKMLESVTSGLLFRNVISKAQVVMNHAAATMDTTEKLDLGDGTLSTMGGNAAILKFKRNVGGADTELVNKWDSEKLNLANEFQKFMQGNGAMTEGARAEAEGLKKATTPSEVKGHLRAMVELMHGQIDPIDKQFASVMKEPRKTRVLPPETLAAMERVQNWEPGATKRETPAQGDAPAAVSIPPAAVAKLRSNPALKAAFDQKYGAGAAAKALAQ